jgi:carbonic anhydrase
MAGRGRDRRPDRPPEVAVPAPLPPALLDGFRRFRSTRYRQERERYQTLMERGQRPDTMLVACSDSRSGPETIFDALPGELFVVRNVGALVPVYAPDNRNHAASAALEYAVLHLNVSSIVVMGHGRCGGVAAALGDASPLSSTDFIGAWTQALRDLADDLEPDDWSDPERAHRALELRSVEQSIVNLETFPWIRSRERAGSLRLAGCWFYIALGELHQLAPDGWRPVS